MLRAALCCVAVLGCGSTGTPVTTQAKANRASQPDPLEAAHAEQVRRDKLGAAHRTLEDEQQTALAATCDKAAVPETRCEPSCYRSEPADSRAGKKLGHAEITHLMCRSPDAPETGPFILADEVAGSTVTMRAAHSRVRAAHKPGTWQAEVAQAASQALQPELGRGDAVRVTGTWRRAIHPVTHEPLRCVTISHYARSPRRALDACGGQGGITCEAAGDPAAHGINVVHYRIAEARRLHAAGNDVDCQRAALEAIAVARGLPRWRQYATLNGNQWRSSARYRTRFDGTLDEDTLFLTAAQLGSDADAIHTECGGGPGVHTTAAQEQSFHRCW